MYACYKVGACEAAVVEAKARFVLIRTLRLLLHLPAYHLRGRSVCAIFLSTRNYSDFYPRDAVLARY